MGLSELSSDSLSLKTENLISSIFKYGYKGKCRNSGIDLILRKEEDTVILSIKDDGIPLDPTIYQKQEEQSASFSKESFSMTYLRILNLNETIIKINTADDKIDKAVIQ